MRGWYRSWHGFCSCEGTMLEAQVVGETRWCYLVEDFQRGNGHPFVKKIFKWRFVKAAG